MYGFACNLAMVSQFIMALYIVAVDKCEVLGQVQEPCLHIPCCMHACMFKHACEHTCMSHQLQYLACTYSITLVPCLKRVNVTPNQIWPLLFITVISASRYNALYVFASLGLSTKFRVKCLLLSCSSSDDHHACAHMQFWLLWYAHPVG